MRVQAVDLDGDGKRETIAEFTTGHSPDNPDRWVFRWTGTSLQLISPTCAAGNLQLSCLGRVSMIDVNGDGKLSLLNWPAFEIHGSMVTPTGKWTLYNIVDGALQATPESLVFAREFRREKGGPFTLVGEFVATAGPGRLRIVTGADGVSSGHVTFSGTEMLKDLKHGQRVYNVPVALKPLNSVTVRLEGKPGSSLTVLVSRQ